MSRYMLSYDVQAVTPSPYGPLIEALAAEEWHPWIKSGNGRFYRLPNTTFVGEFVTRDDAKAAFFRAVQVASREIGRSIMVEKWIVATYLDATFDSDRTAT